MTAGPEGLACEDVVVGYHGRPVVHGLTFDVRPGHVVALLGANGAGKTTTLRGLSGTLPRLGGIVRIAGRPLPSGGAIAANRAGLTYVPDDRALFPSLTVEQHLRLATRRRDREATELIDVFPALRRRWHTTAGSLSGGEQQMLALARGLAQAPSVLLIDELSMGLAPIYVDALLEVVRRVADSTAAAVLHVGLALAVADDAIVLTRGEITLTGPARSIAADAEALTAAYLERRDRDGCRGGACRSQGVAP